MTQCGKFKWSEKVSGVHKVFAKIPLGEQCLQVIWILVLSQHLPHVTAAKPWTLHFLGRRYLSTHHQFHNPLTWSKRQLLRWLLTPAAHLRVSDSGGIQEDNTTKARWTQCNYLSLDRFLPPYCSVRQCKHACKTPRLILEEEYFRVSGLSFFFPPHCHVRKT